MSSDDLRAQLSRLRLELDAARHAGLTGCELYMNDLERELTACREALVGAVVTERANARALIAGPLIG